MPAKIKITDIGGVDVHPDGGILAKVGDSVTVEVTITDRSKSRGGSFRITHGGFAGDTFEFDGRVGTGEAKKLFQRKKKTAPSNYSGQDVFTFSVRVTAAAPLADIILEAVTHCEVLAPATPMQLTAVATEQDLADLLPSFLSVAPQIRLGVTRGGNQGLAANAANALQSRVQFHAALYFLDPEGNERPLPDGVPIDGILGRQRQRHCPTTIERRAVAFAALATDMVLTHQVITLRIGVPGTNVVRCELPGAPSKTQTWGALPTPSDPTGTLPNRCFALPRMATLAELECEVTNHDDRYDATTGRFTLAKDGRPASLGTQSSPVKIVLKPKWQFMRFEFFDRYYGASDHGGENVVMPAVTLEGWETIPGTPTPEARTRSNWWLDQNNDGKVVQCLPWFVQKRADGAPAAKPDIQTEVAFTLPAKTCVKSTSATDRVRVIATDEELKPGPDRLKFYDLPALWKARNYFGAISTTAGEFGWYQDIAAKPTAADRPMVINLDDIVLTGDDGRMIDTWTNDERLAVFANTFDDSVADCTKEGLYKSDAANDAPWLTEKPADDAPEAGWNYVRKLPKWTRLIIAGGNLYDVLDVRSVPGSALAGDETVGARAAVRAVDATDAFAGVEAYEKDPNPPNDYVRAPNDKPEAGRVLHPSRPPRTDRPTTDAVFSIQPFYEQHYMKRFGVYDVGQSAGIGRVDLALLRCCGVANRDNAGSEREVAVHFYFEKTSFEFADPPPAGEDGFKAAYQRNVLDRWNGISPAHGRARLLPQDGTKRIEVDVLTFLQVTDDAVAHHKVTIKDGADARDWRGGYDGTGATAIGNEADSGTTNGFTSAHEHGHERALPDEYNERWAENTSFGQPSFRSTLPGDPFELDGRTVEFQEMGAPMMNGNHHLHNRYFWQSAEWVRRAVGYPFKVKFNGCDEYFVPPHADAQRHYGFWPLDARLAQGLPPVDPITANRATFNGYLYALGKDKFATRTLKDKEGGGATDYDGILLVTVLLKVVAPVGDADSCKSFTQAIARVCRKFGSRKLNHRFYLTGTAAQGAPHEWTFTRCLLHFSPRVLVSAHDLATREQFLASIATYGNFPESDNYANALRTYHNVPWSPIGPKQNAINTLKTRLADPYRAVDGDWAVASAAIVAPPPPPVDPNVDPPPPPPPPPPPRPAEFDEIDTKLGELALLGHYDFDQRKAALKVIVDQADGFLVADGASPYADAARAIKARAETGINAVEVGLAMAWIHSYADTIEGDRSAHEALVTEIANAHPPHFTLRCVNKPVAPPVWKIDPPAVELPKKSDWLLTVDSAARGDGRVVTAGNNLDTYHGKAHGDYGGRLGALDTLETAADAGDMSVPEGDWATASQVKNRPMQYVRVDSRLRDAKSAGDTEFKKRADEMRSAITLLNEVISGKRSSATKDPARALKGRLEAAIASNLAMVALRALEAKAKARKTSLQLEAASQEVTLTAPDPDAFEDALLEVFPSMIGVYKAASEISAADLKPLVDTLGLTNADVHAI